MNCAPHCQLFWACEIFPQDKKKLFYALLYGRKVGKYCSKVYNLTTISYKACL